jgi:hypothetical protein
VGGREARQGSQGMGKGITSIFDPYKRWELEFYVALDSLEDLVSQIVDHVNLPPTHDLPKILGDSLVVC